MSGLQAREPEAIGGHIYFVRCGDFIKIGWSSHFVRRIEHMRGLSPQKLELVGVLHGGRNQERLLHRTFAKYREHGEWFRCEGELAAYIEQRTELRLWSLSEAAQKIAASVAQEGNQ